MVMKDQQYLVRNSQRVTAEIKNTTMIMKICIFAILIFLISCVSTSDKSVHESPRKDSLYVKNEWYALILSPTSNELERIRAKYNTEEDFFVMADDAANYNFRAIEYLKQNDIPIIYVDTLTRVINFNHKCYVDISDTLQINNPLWQILLYKPNYVPQIIESIDIKSAVIKYNDHCASTTGYKYSGTWTINKEQQFPYITIHKDSTAYMVVESDQLNIVVKLLRSKESVDVFHVFLLKPVEELGIGGQKLSWDNFSKSTPIANIMFESDTIAKLNWLGFYNVSTKQREWEECQFNRENGETPVILIRL